MDDYDELDEDNEVDELDVQLSSLNITDTKILLQERITNPIITKYELVRILGVRANQIQNTNIIFIDENPKFITALEYAEEEIRQGKCPLSILRQIYKKNGIDYCERWDVNELAVPYNF